jgi:hypothetical protein
MRAAIRRYARGTATVLPFRVRVHLVAAAYGQTPEAVRAWPADDFMDACSFLGVTTRGS